MAYRYSDLGKSFSNRMSTIFSTTPKIYGFSSIAPVGDVVEPMLAKYLLSTKSYYQNFSEYLWSVEIIALQKITIF